MKGGIRLKKVKKLYIAFIFAILVIPSLSFIVSDGSVVFPELFADGYLNTDFPAEVSESFESELPVKDEIITLNNVVKSKIFKSESANVVTGKSGWLFYSETTDDYLGANQLSQREIFSCAETLRLISEYCEGQGADFVFAAVPNKNSVLGEYMPFNFIDGGSGNLQSLSAELADMGVKEADIYAAVTGDTVTGSLYFKTDTHWNSHGAYIGFSEIIRSLQNEMPKALQNLTASDFEQTAARSTDLSALLFTFADITENTVQMKNAGEIYDKIRITIRGAATTDTAELISLIDDKDESFSQISTKSTADDAAGKLFCLRDSFCRAMLPYFAYTYESALFIKSAECNAYIYDIGEYDDFVFEIVERNIGEILESRQLIPAAERDIGEITETAADGGTITVNTDYSDYVMISGEIDLSYIDNDSSIYVSLTDLNTGAQSTYEAFPAVTGSGVQEYYLTLPYSAYSQYSARLIVGSAVVGTDIISF